MLDTGMEAYLSFHVLPASPVEPFPCFTHQTPHLPGVGILVPLLGAALLICGTERMAKR